MRYLHTSVFGLAFAAASLFATQTRASIVDLTTNQSGTVSGALFYRADFQSAGTGFIDPFVRLQHDNGPSNNNHSGNGIEQGYNTSGNPVQYDELTDPNYTHNLTFGDIPQVIIDGVAYLQFLLDINEPNGGGSNLLSLDQVNIYTSGTGSQNGVESSLGTLRWSLGAFLNDNTVTLDYNLNSGSGQGDMQMYVPLANFAGVLATDYVYLYSHFGGLGPDYRTGDGFEEWAVLQAVPGPGALALLAIAGMLGGRRRRVC